ncbi:MAG: ABC transporter ATP-binding protein [Neisseria sp.]|nr:ABC transporter ATP-binding protein [Neisseria sp.]
MIQILSLSHRYPQAATAALNNVSFDIADGECLGLLGHNGAGKTTLMSLMAGLQDVQQGEILFDGKPLRRLSRSERQKIGLVPQDFAFYPQLSVWDNLLFFASLYKMRDQGRLNALLEQTDLTAHKNKAAKHLSGGLKRRLNFAIGLINAPQLVFLDEITVGIDPQSRRFILESVADLTRQGVTVVYTSHYLSEIEQLCGKIVLLQQGRPVYGGSLDGLLNAQAQTVRFITEPPLPPQTLAALGATAADTRGMMETAHDAAAVYAALQQSGAQIRYFQQGHGSLEAFYLDFLRHDTNPSDRPSRPTTP